MIDCIDRDKLSFDSFLRGKIKAYQDINGYRSGVDALLLASVVLAKKRDKILDIGCGVGIASLALASIHDNIEVYGIEKTEYFYKLAKENADINVLGQSKFIPYWGNIMDKSPFDFQFDSVMANPPYFKANYSNIELRDVANIESDAKMEDFIRFAFHNLKNHGYFYIIQRSERIKELLDSLPSKHWGNIEIFPIYSYSNKPAKRCILRAKKLGKNIFIMNSGIIMHNMDGSYTEHGKSVLEEGMFYLKK